MKTFALFVAPWDLADRGTGELLCWARDQGINTIYLASVYHAGWFLHPHHRHKAYMVEDGACYFHPNLAEYERTPLKPLIGKLAAQTDWVGQACEHSRKLGLKIVLWTVCLHNTRLGLAHPETTCRNVYDDSYPHALCPSHPAVREYVASLVRDQAKRYRPDGFLLEATSHHRGRTHGSPAGGIAGHHHERDGLPMPALEQHLLNLSFAESDCRAAEAAGIDAARLGQRIQDHLDRFFASTTTQRPAGLPDTLEAFRESCPELARYEKVLGEQADQLVAQVKAQQELKEIELLGDGPRPGLDGMLIGCYNEPEERIEPIISAAKRRNPPGRSLIVALRLGFNPPPATPAINSVEQGCRIAAAIADCQPDGMGFYFYGEAPAATLGWIQPMIRAAADRERSRGKPADKNICPTGVALIGAGVIGEIHLRALRGTPGARLVAVTDTNRAKAEQLAQRLGIERVAANVDGLLEDANVDLVVIATPPKSHLELAQRVLRANKNLLIEKPLGLSLQHADEIARAAAATSKAVGVALVHRYDGARLAARQLIRSGAIGRVRLIRYRWGKHMYNDPRFDGSAQTDRDWLVDASISGGGLLPSSAIHSLSVLSFLLGGARIVSVGGAVRRLHPRSFDGIEDDVSLLLELDSRVEARAVGNAHPTPFVEATFDESWACDIDYEMRIEGESGHLRLAGPLFNTVVLTGECRGPIPESLRRLFEGRRIVCRPHELDDQIRPYFQGLTWDMISACRGGDRGELPDIIHGRNLRAVIAAAVQASASGHRVQVDWREAAALRRGQAPTPAPTPA